MKRTVRRLLAAAIVLATAATLAEPQAKAVQPPPLFSNYYVGGPPNGGVPAQLYISPRPAPPLVGHTWITYQPLMPHEFLYQHHRKYYRFYPGGHNVTTVKWR